VLGNANASKAPRGIAVAFINDRYADVVQQILSAPIADSVRQPG
jgi:hypothetical protein